MKSEKIKLIEIESNKLLVFPEKEIFPYIYRSAMEVHWDEKKNCLYAPDRKEWSYVSWFQQIINAAKDEYRIELIINEETIWKNISEELHLQIMHYTNKLIDCPKCNCHYTPEEIINGIKYSWPELSWVLFHCNSCGNNIQLQISENKIGIIKNISSPGPDYEIGKIYKVDNLTTRIDPAYLHCWLNKKHYEFKEKDEKDN